MKKVANIKLHKTAKSAYNETVKNGIIACAVTTYINDVITKDYYSFKSNSESQEELYNDFPYSIGSNQSIEFIDQFD